MTWTSNDTADVKAMLADREERLRQENLSVAAMLNECNRDKVQPPKNYWGNQVRLQNQVKALKLLLETTK